MTQKDLKFQADLLHTIFCGHEHEEIMELIDQTDKCCYYLEKNLDRTWELPAHIEWYNQAQLLVKISQPLEIKEVLQDIIKIYNIAEEFKKVNPKLLDYIKILIM